MQHIAIIASNTANLLAQRIAAELATPIFLSTSHYFPSGELQVALSPQLYQNHKQQPFSNFFLVHNLYPSTHDKIIELIFLLNQLSTLNVPITLILPYLAYGRQPNALQTIAELLKTSKVVRVITVDIHCEEALKCFKIPIINLNSTSILKEVLKMHDRTLLIAPDKGAHKRVKTLAAALDQQHVAFYKKRSNKGCALNLEENIAHLIAGKDCFIIDDIVDTGATLGACFDRLKAIGARSISAFITHGLFTQDALDYLQQRNFTKFYLSNSVEDKNMLPYFQTVDLGPSLAAAATLATL